MHVNELYTLVQDIAKRHNVADLLSEMNEIEYTINIAFLGEFSAGKTSLINALLGRKTFPVFSEPTNAIITEIYKSEDNSNHYIIHEMTEEGPKEREISPSQLVKEITSPEPGKVLKAYVTSEFLKKDYCLIDTPGVSSIENVHEEVVLGYLPNVDVAFIVIDSTFGGTTASLAKFLKQLPQRIITKIYVVITKIDLVSEQDLKKVKSAVLKSLEGIIPSERILSVSSMYALEGIEKGDPKLIEKSHINDIKKIIVEEIPNLKKQIYEKKQLFLLKEKSKKLKDILEDKLNALRWNEEELEKQIQQTSSEKHKIEKEFEDFKLKIEETKTRTLNEVSEIIDRYAEIVSADLNAYGETNEKITEDFNSMINEIAEAIRYNVAKLHKINVPGLNESFEKYLVISTSERVKNLKEMIDFIVDVSAIVIMIWLIPGPTAGKADMAEAVIAISERVLSKFGKTIDGEKKKSLKNFLRAIDVPEKIKKVFIPLITKRYFEKKLRPIVMGNIKRYLEKMEDDIIFAVQEDFIRPLQEKEKILEDLIYKRKEKIRKVEEEKAVILKDLEQLNSIMAE